jgi:hypothetical protein
MADGGGSVAREESGDDLLYTRVRWRGSSQVHHDGKVTVWRGVRWRRRAGTAETPVASGGKVGTLGHGARGARGVGEEGGAAQGGVDGVRIGGPRPTSVCGPSRTVGWRRASWSAELWWVASKFRFSPV